MAIVQRHGESGRAPTAVRIMCAVIAALALPAAAFADWSTGVDASLRHDSNVGNAQFASDIVADTTLDGRISLFRILPLDDGYSLTLGGDLGGEVYEHLSGLNNASLDAEVSLKKKWGLGAWVPWMRAGLSAGRSSYADSYRDAWIYHATLAAGRRIDERWNLWAEYQYENLDAKPQPEEVPGLSGDAYSQRSHNLSAHVEYALTSNTYFSAAMLARHGDVVSTSAPNYMVYSASLALAEDPAFGPDAYAYRITGTTYGLRLGIHFSPTAHSLIGAEFARFETHADGGNNYTKSVPAITWDYAF
jgi:hypothetical protein